MSIIRSKLTHAGNPLPTNARPIVGKTIVGVALLCVGLVFLNTGCTTIPRDPIVLDKDAFSVPRGPITLMPLIDGRTDTSASFDSGDKAKLMSLAKKQLEEQGYSVQMSDGWKGKAAISDQELNDMSTAELCQLAPSGATAILVITVNSVHNSYTVMTTSFAITSTMVLIDPTQKKEIWKDAVTGEHSGGGILDAALALMGKRSGAYNALMTTAFSSLPKAGETGVRSTDAK